MSQVEMHKSVKDKSCRKEYVLFNHIDQINFTQNEHTRDFSADRLDFYAIQIQPQRVHIKLKKCKLILSKIKIKIFYTNYFFNIHCSVQCIRFTFSFLSLNNNISLSLIKSKYTHIRIFIRQIL